MKVAIFNIGKIVSGDWEKGILKGDTVLIEDGKFKDIGYERELHPEKADIRIDANGMVLIPGLIDPHTHFAFGEWGPENRMIGVTQEGLYQGITTAIDEFARYEGEPDFYPPNPEGVKASAIVHYFAWKNYRPGGLMKVHGGSLLLVKGLKESDIRDVANLGIWKVAQIGGSSDLSPKELLEMASWARKYGMFIPTNFGAGVLKTSVYLDADFVKQLQPDKLAHANGGSTAASWELTREVIDGAKNAAVEIVAYGNWKMALRILDYLKTKNELHRVILGSDTPTGQGYFPVGINQAIKFVSSLGNIPAEKAIAMATGNTYNYYKKWIHEGKIEVGLAADCVIIDKPPGSVGNDALGAIENGDMVGPAMVMVDGKIAALRGMDSRPTTRYIKLNGRELGVTDPNERQFDPPRFYWKSVGETYLLLNKE
jgi:enamidase